MADASGNINTNSDVGNIVVQAGKSMVADRTTTATYTNNLDAGVATISSVSGGKPVAEKSYKTKEEGSVIPSNLNMVTLILKDGSEVVLTSGGPYTVGDKYTFSETTGKYAAAVTGETDVLVNLADGYTITANPDDDYSGSYTVGELHL